MFERIRNALAARQAATPDDDDLNRWAAERMLTRVRRKDGGFAFGGQWMERPFRVECAASSRGYIQDFELKAKADLDLTHEVNLILMNRALKRSLEAQANVLHENASGAPETRAKPPSEEVRWLSMYRDAGWPGPDDHFWARYAVLTDAPEVARRCLDAEAIAMLMGWPRPVHERTPVLLMLTRGKTYLRLELGDPSETDAALHALDVFEHFSARAARLLAR